MAASQDPLLEGDPSVPSMTGEPETPSASSNVYIPNLFPVLEPSSQVSVQTQPSSRNPRKLVIDSSASLPAFPSQPIRRKPLSATASPLATRYSSGEYLTIARELTKPDSRYSRSFSVDSPTLYEYPPASIAAAARLPPTPGTPRTPDAAVEHQEHISDNTQELPASEEDATVIAGGIKPPSALEGNPEAHQTNSTNLIDYDDNESALEHEEEVTGVTTPSSTGDQILGEYFSSSDSYNSNNSNNMSTLSRKATPAHLHLEPFHNTGVHQSSATLDPNSPRFVNKDKPLPKSPGSSKFGTFFGWGTSPTSTEFSTDDKGYSALPSPASPFKLTAYTDASPVTTPGPSSFPEAPKADANPENSLGYCEAYLATPSAVSPPPPVQIEEMEEELKAISGELAASIRREMDLEDLVDRLQSQVDNPQSGNKRTSDYFSDSGYSSAKFSEYDQARDEIEKVTRRAEQEKASVRLELTSKLQDERSRRQQLDEQIKELAEKASQVDTGAGSSHDTNERVRDLENTCETLRRKLAEEREVKDNFEDLLSALKGDLQSAVNERDNLRDEIVPQLKARVDGLETQATDLEKLNYETTKMQQELQTLKVENSTLKQRRIDSIAEEPGSRKSVGLGRSNSITGPPSSLRLQKNPSLSRSVSVKVSESRDALSERLKDVEAQRDALHSALKNLLERQEHQNRENDKKIRVLELEREKMLTSSPKKARFSREVFTLRDEINVLRRRAEDALEEKWQVEKGLSGLKMDLDRAEEEIASLRSLLQENDILIPPSFARSSTGSDKSGVPTTSASLEAAYRDLQDAYAESLERIKELELDSSHDEKTLLAIERLETALSSAISERDLALHDVATYKAQLVALQAGEKTNLDSENALADQLQESARRIEELSIQVNQQLTTNSTLRQRLTDTVKRGEAEQKSNVERITAMQARLRTLEEHLVAAQTASEDRVSRHEEEISSLKEAHNTALGRLGSRDSGLRSPRMFPPKSPLSPFFASPTARSPRLSPRLSPAKSVADDTQVEALRARVIELERALSDTEAEMQEVVGRMNTAQIEVLQLQEEREAAMRETKRLQHELQTEKVKAFEEKFKTLSS